MAEKELLQQKNRTLSERLHLHLPEGTMLAALFAVLRISVEVEGEPADSKALILAGYPHTSHLDTAAIAIALRQKGKKNIFPVPKGDYWDRNGYRRLLRLFFSGQFYMTKSSKKEARDSKESFFDLFLRNVENDKRPHTVILFPSGGRNVKGDKVHRGAFVAAARAFVEQGKTVPVQPVEIRNAPDVLTHGDLKSKEIRSILLGSIKKAFTGQTNTITVKFHKEINPSLVADTMEIESYQELSGALMQAYLDVVKSSQGSRP